MKLIQGWRMRSEAGHVIAAGVMLVFAALTFGAAAQEGPAEPEVVIPNFWGPADRSDRAEAPINGIRFVTSDDYPPFNFTDADGRLIGFNVDLARAICDVLAIPCTIQVRAFDDLITALLADRADAAIAGIAISPASRGLVGFSDVYLGLPGRFAVRRGMRLTVSASGLAGRTVAVVAGTAHEAFLAAFFTEVIPLPYASADAASAALRSGEADAMFGDGLQISFWLQGTTAGDCCAFAGGPYLEPAYFGHGMAIAVAPDEPDIVAEINAALRAVHENGDYARLYLRYFPISFY